MFEAVDKVVLAGLGVLSMTRQRAEEIFDEAVKRGQAVQANRQGFVKTLMETADKTRAEVAKIVSEQVHTTVSKLSLATKDDLKQVEQKLDQILQQLK